MAATIVKGELDHETLQQAAKFGDPRYSDFGSEHRQAMRQKLYGDGRENRIRDSYSEAGALGANYADERPPEWKSTFQSDYTRKGQFIGVDDIDTQANNTSNFELRSHSSDYLPPMMSSTQRDYIVKHPMPIEKLRRATAYPPIFRDEHELESTKSVYTTTFTSDNNHHTIISHPDSTTAHFEFGDDLPLWSSITKSNYRPVSPPSPIHIEAAENKKSTVLDNPDGEEYFIMPANLDRRDLIVDNRATVKDLKSTHFTLGTVEGFAVKSQYQSSFTQHSLVRTDQVSEKLKGTYSSVKIEDEDEPPVTRSTHQNDFINFQRRLDIIRQMKFSAKELKTAQSNASISFGTDSGGFSNHSRSITRSDFKEFPRPSTIQGPIAKPKLRFGVPKPAKRFIPPRPGHVYPPIAASSDDNLSTGVTIMRSDFAVPDSRASEENGEGTLASATKLKNVARQRAKEFLSGTHFTFGSDDQKSLNTAFREHFGPPASNGSKATKPICLVKDLGFEASLANTITRYLQPLSFVIPVMLIGTIYRYPGDQSTFTTVNSSVYCRHGKYTKPELIPHHTDTVASCIAPESDPIPGVLTSETKRTYIPPEAMICMNKLT
ncbi:hypothetical protein HDU97_008749 [Phlyctochytrium planicorne]|nr:hypothetical protein HDU97_008749 [Phlyctochytrium planicorne]